MKKYEVFMWPQFASVHSRSRIEYSFVFFYYRVHCISNQKIMSLKCALYNLSCQNEGFINIYGARI